MSQVNSQQIKILAFEMRQLLPEQSNVALARVLGLTPAAISKWTKGKTSALKEETKTRIVSLLGCPQASLEEFLSGALSWDEFEATCSSESIHELNQEEPAASKESFFRRIDQLTWLEAVEALQAILKRLTTLKTEMTRHGPRDIVEVVEALTSLLDLDSVMQVGERVKILLGDRITSLERRMQELGLLESRPFQHNPLFRKLEEYRLEAGLSREQLSEQLYLKSGGRFDKQTAAAIAAGKLLPDNGEVLWVGCLLRNPQGEFYSHDELLALRAGNVDFFSASRSPEEPDEPIQDLEAKGGNGIKSLD
ncbi:hypothetical protein NG799_19000 [Laspinema sp. D1]|uniref:HTH cro/C1-type domain-containing protein n=1 Tax=Laspinema palackyanum D2a TaxID=2953684 RepID=A0ABT2MWN9_9CYAN|nr:hypothetical protein [Laspinema sp. D2a]